MSDGDHVSLDLQGGTHVGIERRSSNRHRSIKTTTPPSELVFDNEKLINHISSLHKRAFVGQWNFLELSDFEMRISVDKQWKSLLGYMSTIVHLLRG